MDNRRSPAPRAPASPRVPGPPRVPGGEPGGWTAVWADECDAAAGTPPDPSRWGVRLTDEWQPPDELQLYSDDPENAHYDGRGHLVLTAVRTREGARPYTSARLSARHAAGRPVFRFGRFAARVNVPTALGVWPAWWLLGPDDRLGWPACGEVDIMEAPSSAATRGEAHQGVHAPRVDGDGAASVGVTPSRGDWGADFHVFGVDWVPGRMEFFIDDRVTGAVTRSGVEAVGGRWVFDDVPLWPILNLAVGGWAGDPDPAWSHQSMLVDWVRISARR